MIQEKGPTHFTKFREENRDGKHKVGIIADMVYIAMLRGVNVGGRGSIKMESLRALFEKMGFDQIQTYIQSGNVVFSAPKASPNSLAKSIESSLIKAYGFPISVVLRTSQQLEKVLKANPFLHL